MATTEDTIQVRLRHVHGDIGPFSLPATTTVASLTETAYAEWPADGPLAPFKPNSALEVKLISNGRFVENSSTLADVLKAFGAVAADFVVTLHVIVRPPQASSKGSSVKGAAAVASQRSCACVIC